MRYLGWLRRSSDEGRPRPHAAAAARNAMATASSRRRAIASSVRCSTATLLRIVQPDVPVAFGGSSCSPGDRTDQLPGEELDGPSLPYLDPGRRVVSSSPLRATSTKSLSGSGAWNALG